MPKFKFSKLVRDKIVPNQISSGARPKYHKLNEQDHKQQLIFKIIEEAKEITSAKPEDLASEIADVQQALDDLIKKYKLTKKDVSIAQKRKRDKYGSFKKGFYVDYIEIPENYDWTAYYRQHPDRYPEIK